MTVNTKFDVVIAGAGPAGVAAACTLARSGRRVLLLEKRQGRRLNVGETIAPVAKSLVEGFLGPLNGTLPEWATVSRGNTSIWGDDRPFSHDFFFNPYGTGLCVNRDGFDDALRDVSQGLGVTLWRGASVAAAARDDTTGGWDIAVKGMDGGLCSIKSSYLVDATGRGRVIQKILGETDDANDPLMAFAQHFVTDSPEDRDGFSRIEAAAFGWWYSNRIPTLEGSPPERVVVLHCDPDTEIATQVRTSAGFQTALATSQLIQPLLATHGYRPTGRVRGSMAGGACAIRTKHPRFLAVGDAAQAFDPLSSQGIQHALQSGKDAGKALHYALANTDAPAPFLDRYAQQMRCVWDHYQANHQKYYSMEPRFSEHAFWRNRRIDAAHYSPNTARDIS